MLEENRQEPVFPEDRKRTFEAQSLMEARHHRARGAGDERALPGPALLRRLRGRESLPRPPSASSLRATPRRASCSRATASSPSTASASPPSPSSAASSQKSPNKELKLSVFRGKEHVEVVIVPEEKTLDKPLEIVETWARSGSSPSRPAAVVGVSKHRLPGVPRGAAHVRLVTEVRGKARQDASPSSSSALRENRGETVPVTYLRPVPVRSALGSLGRHGRVRVGRRRAHAGRGARRPEPRARASSPRTFTWDVPEGSAEHKAELRPGDRITEVDRVEVTAWSMMIERGCSPGADKPHVLTFERQGQRRAA
jgi:regulator of sigma E protease